MLEQQAGLAPSEKTMEDPKHLETVNSQTSNLAYSQDDEEPELHARTYFAVAAMFFLNMVQVLALQGPPTVLSTIGEDLHNSAAQTWVPNALSLVQAVVGPIISSVSDLFQVRKALLVGPAIISFIGAAIAPGSTSICRLIVAQILIGFGFATVPLAYCVPSEILPRKWRPIVQAGINIAAAIGACTGPLAIGALTRANPHKGWRIFYWIQMGFWGLSAVGLFIGYRPPKRHTRYDHLSFWQKIGRLDIIGTGLLTTGLTLVLTGLNLGGSIFKWASAQVLGTLVVGVVVMVAFCVYEWKFTKTGILHHDLFRGGKDRGRTFAACVGLIFIEGILLFAYVIFYPIMTGFLFETDPFLTAAREQAFWIGSGTSTIAYGYAATKLKSIRSPLFVGFFLFTCGVVGLATIEPNDSTNSIIFAGLAGLGMGGPLVLIVAGVQLSTPHHLIATATAVATSSRAVSATSFTAIYDAALNSRLDKYIPSYVGAAALKAGLPEVSLGSFITALAGHNATALRDIPGVTSIVIQESAVALKQAYADGLRVVFIIAAPFGVVACIACFFLGDLKPVMDYAVEAPVEALHAKHTKPGNVGDA